MKNWVHIIMPSNIMNKHHANDEKQWCKKKSHKKIKAIKKTFLWNKHTAYLDSIIKYKNEIMSMQKS